MEKINKLLAAYPAFIPGLVVRLGLHLEVGPSWDAVMESARSLNSAFSHQSGAGSTSMITPSASIPGSEHMEALKALFLYHVCKEGRLITAESYLKTAANVSYSDS